VSEALHAKIVTFLSAQFARKDRQATEIHLFYAPGPGSRDEELDSWSREDKPEMFETLALIEKTAQGIIDRCEEHADGFAAGRHRYVIQVTQHLGGRPRYPFSLQPRHSLADDPDGTALTTDGAGGPGGRRAADALARGFDIAMRSNTMMYTGTIGAMVSTNKMLSEENVTLREQNHELRLKLEEAESLKEDRRHRREQDAKSDAIKGEAIKQVFQFGQIAITKALGGATGGEAAPPRVMMLLKTLKESIQAAQVEALSKIFTQGQLMAFIEVMQIIEASEAAPPPQPQQPNGAANGHANAGRG
jgi:regulator of replication initiation timing